MRVFLDTNILLDVLLARPGLADESGEVIHRCSALHFEMFVAWHGLATAYYLLKRGRAEAGALAEIDRILAWAHIATTGDSEARAARSLGFPDFEDALQATSAHACGADCIVTRNHTDFKTSPVAAITPSRFLHRYPAP